MVGKAHKVRPVVRLVSIAATLLLVVLVSEAVTQERDLPPGSQVTIAAFGGAAPVIFVNEDGEATGIYPDVLTAALTDLGYEPVFVTGLSFPDAYQAVVDGEIDIMPALIRTEARQAELSFNWEPVMVSWSQVFTVGGPPPGSILELENARVAVQENGQNGRSFRELMSSFDIPYEEVAFPDLDAAVSAARSGEADVVVAFNTFHLTNPEVAPTSIVFAPTSAYLASALGSNATLLGQMDEWIASQKLDDRSEYNRIMRRWVGQDQVQVIPSWLITLLGIVVLIAVSLLVLVRGYRKRVRTTTERLEQSEIRFRTIFDVAADIILVYELEDNGTSVIPTVIREANDSACTILDIPREQLLQRSVLDLIAPADRDVFLQANSMMGDSESEVTQVELRTSDGTDLPFEMNLRRFSARERLFVTAACRDIGERLEAERELRDSLSAKEVLLGEIHHRVKNNLQTIASLVNIRLINIDDDRVRSPLLEMADRVHAMGLLHRMLYQNDDFSSIDLLQYTESLCRQVWSTHLADKDQFVLDVTGDQVIVDLDTALPFGLILNEAVANAIKHGFDGRDSGRVTVRVRRMGDRASIEIADDGAGLSSERDNEPGIGLELIQMLSEQLDGTHSIRSDGGVTVRVEFPLRDRSVVQSLARHSERPASRK